jgi:hypothetical protein
MSGKITALKEMTWRSLEALGKQVGFGPVHPLNVTARETMVISFQRAENLAVDGWPGNATYYALWKKGHRPSTPGEIVQVARSWCNLQTTYDLGAGGYKFFADWVSSECDCSGFVASVLARSRKPQPDCPYWLSTDFIWRDCATNNELFTQIDGPAPGAIVVYPDDGGQQGHAAIVTSFDGSKIFGIDCSGSGSRLRGEAVSERDISFFNNKDSRYCYPVWLQGQSD